jgi:hypothetical protein
VLSWGTPKRGKVRRANRGCPARAGTAPVLFSHLLYPIRREENMEKTVYFSFFGEVKAPPWAEIRRLREDIAEHIVYLRKIRRRIRGRRPVWEQEASGIYAQAFRTRRPGVVLLIVECPAGGWLEVSEVFWPLEFEGPAAVAGYCCFPRHGLG